MKVCYITDEKYAMPTCVSMVSLKANASCKVTVYVICDNVSDESKSLFKKVENESFHVELIDNQITDDYSRIVFELQKKTGTYVSRSALLKFYIPEIFSDLKKLLYLDSDIIINKDITALWDSEISDSYVAAVDDMTNGTFLGDEYQDLSEQIGLENSYFNSGVMLLNLDMMRRDNITEKLKVYRMEGNNYFMDQDAFNSILGVKRKAAPFEFNFLASMVYKTAFDHLNEIFFDNKYTKLQECIMDQHIIHMTGCYKPWKYEISYITPIFDKFYSISPYGTRELNKKELVSHIYSEYLETMRKVGQLYEEMEVIKKERAYLQECKAQMDWHFPSEKINKGSRLVLYGAGEVGRTFYRYIQSSNYCEISLWVDRNYEKITEYNIYEPEKILDTEYDYLLIALSRHDDIENVVNYLIGKGLADDRIVTIYS